MRSGNRFLHDRKYSDSGYLVSYKTDCFFSKTSWLNIGPFLTHGSSEGRFVSQCHHMWRNYSSGLLPWRTNMQFEQCARTPTKTYCPYITVQTNRSQHDTLVLSK